MDAATASDWLALVARELHGPDIDLEYSVRMSADGATASGRYTCWAGKADSIDGILVHLGAPPTVMAANAGLELPIRRGIGIDVTGEEPEYRLYLHGRDPITLAESYRSWRWRSGAAARPAAYTFHYMPETATGLRPESLIGRELRPMLESLLEHERLAQCSGFWLRTNADGVIDQLDLALPWHPVASSLAGLRAIADWFGIGASGGWQDLHIRHIALRVGLGRSVMTLYVRGAANGPIPVEESGFRERARRGAADHAARVRRHDRPFGADGRSTTLDDFYSGDLESWRHVLGPGLHYHHGLFDEALAPDMDTALGRAVTELYPFIPAGGRLYDIGCGWGGPLAMWIRDLRCPSLGLTISRTQFRYVASRGLPVRWGDAERTLPPGYFDCAVLLESFEHIVAKRRLLEVLTMFTGRIVMRVNCQDRSPPSTAFGETMHMISSAQLRSLLSATGWRITHWRDRRAEAMPSVACWNSRANRADLVADAHLAALRTWSGRVLSAPAEWAAANPLIEVVAEST